MKSVTNKVIISIVYIFLASFKLYCQEIPLFETTFYFEDTIGNKDSIILGYDTNIDPYTINENFNEKEIIEPFDSVFEVRALHKHDLKERTSKKIIGLAEKFDNMYLISSQIVIVVHIKNKPLKVSYDISKFANVIRGGSYLTHTITKDALGIEYLQPWEFFCLSTVDNHFFTFPDSLYKNNDIRGIRYIGNIKGNKKDTLYGIEVTFRPYNCLYKTSTNQTTIQQLNCFPTISQDFINVSIPEDLKIDKLKIVNIVGIEFELKNYLDTNFISLDISKLPLGIYIGKINNQFYFKFIKS